MVSANPPVIEVKDLKKHFPVKKGLLRRTVGQVYAVDGVTFTVRAGETLGLVGESGCGKTTAGRAAMRLVEPTSGSIKVEGKEIIGLSKAELRPYRRQMQIIFQDPFSSLNPRMTAGDIVGEPLLVHGVANAKERQEQVSALFARVGLRPAQMSNYPHQFSGGQRARIGIARALAVRPEFLVCDESVAALDVSIQAQVLNLFMDLRRALSLTYLFISHDLGVVQHISDRVVIMYLGRVVESGPTAELFAVPNHPYTQALLAGIGRVEARKRTFEPVKGEIPSPLAPPPGCHFHPRCPHAMARCRNEAPPLVEFAPGRRSACWLNETRAA